MDQSTPPNPPQAVRDTCSWVTENATDVTLDTPSLTGFISELKGLPSLSVPSWEEWHYSDAEVAGGDGSLTASYVGVLDTLNFCFWPSPANIEYDALALGLRKVLLANPRAFDAESLIGVTEEEVSTWTTPPLPNLPQRAAALREWGQGLKEHFGGKALNLVTASKGSCVTLLTLILDHFPHFRDTAVYSAPNGEAKRVCFYKRAQILCGDLWAAFLHNKGRKGGPTDFHDIAQLTAFADYRLPQLLREKGVMRYSKALGEAIDGGEELPTGGSWECEIRAATVVAVERIKGGLEGVSSMELDWLLWNVGEAQISAMRKHHRVRSTFY